MYYYGARYYDPYIGRFTQRDPIGDGLNWYIYAANNPLKFIDPTGLEIVWENGRIYDRKSWIEKVRNYLHRWASKFTGPADPYNVPAPSGPPMPGGTVVGEPEAPKFDPTPMAVKAVIYLVFGPVSPNHEKQLQTDRGFKDEIDRQGGYQKLGEPGNRKGTIRHLDGGDKAAQDFFGHLRGNRDVRPETNPKTGITTYIGTDPDGNVITYRSGSKGKGNYSGQATVGIQKGKKEIKLRFNE